MKKNYIGLIVVSGGVAEEHSRNAYVRIVDIDNIKAGDPKVQLPRGMGFEELVKEAGVEEYVEYMKE
jgi:hypothetical protein